MTKSTNTVHEHCILPTKVCTAHGLPCLPAINIAAVGSGVGLGAGRMCADHRTGAQQRHHQHHDVERGEEHWYNGAVTLCAPCAGMSRQLQQRKSPANSVPKQLRTEAITIPPV